MTSELSERCIWVICRASHESTTLSDALRAQGAEVVTLTFPGSESQEPLTGQGLSGLAATLGAALREVIDGVDITSLEAAIRVARPEPDGVLFLESDVARRVQPCLRARLGSARQLGVEAHLGLDEAWSALGIAVVSARDTGGALSGLGQEQRRLEDEKEHLAIATHGLDLSWVDPLLLQLSIASLDERPLIFLPSGDSSIDDHLKNRAAFYGLEGQRPNVHSDLDLWIRGARAVVGAPSGRQTVASLTSGVPIVFVGELQEGSDARWAIEHGQAYHGRTPVEVSVALERCLREVTPPPLALSGVDEAATAVMKLLDAEEPTLTARAGEAGQEEMETIGRAPRKVAPSPDHERLEIDDALADLKRRMGLNDVEG